MNEQNLKPFKKGDTRINRKGRPRLPAGLRDLALDILSEPATGPGGEPITANGKQITKVEAILRAAAQSKDPRQRQWLIEVGFGKIAQTVELNATIDGELHVSIDR